MSDVLTMRRKIILTDAAGNDIDYLPVAPRSMSQSFQNFFSSATPNTNTNVVLIGAPGGNLSVRIWSWGGGFFGATKTAGAILTALGSTFRPLIHVVYGTTIADHMDFPGGYLLPTNTAWNITVACSVASQSIGLWAMYSIE